MTKSLHTHDTKQSREAVLEGVTDESSDDCGMWTETVQMLLAVLDRSTHERRMTSDDDDAKRRR